MDDLDALEFALFRTAAGPIPNTQLGVSDGEMEKMIDESSARGPLPAEYQKRFRQPCLKRPADAKRPAAAQP